MDVYEVTKQMIINGVSQIFTLIDDFLFITINISLKTTWYINISLFGGISSHFDNRCIELIVILGVYIYFSNLRCINIFVINSFLWCYNMNNLTLNVSHHCSHLQCISLFLANHKCNWWYQEVSYYPVASN